MSELKSCPFCGGEARLSQYPDNGSLLAFTWTVCCVDENCIGYTVEAGEKRKKTAAAAWNTRAPQQPQPAAVPSEPVNRIHERFQEADGALDHIFKMRVVGEVHQYAAKARYQLGQIYRAARQGQIHMSEDFKAGARAMFDALLFRAANNYHPRYKEQCDHENELIRSWAIDALEEVSPADCAQWRNIDAAYKAGFEEGKIYLCGGWCKHGVMESNRCDQCIEVWKAAGMNVVYHEGNEEEFKAALEKIISRQLARKKSEEDTD